jgi:ABC-type branched-subunit amino acid transport system ATPase component
MLEACDIKVTLGGASILKGVSLSVAPGEIVFFRYCPVL